MGWIAMGALGLSLILAGCGSGEPPAAPVAQGTYDYLLEWARSPDATVTGYTVYRQFDCGGIGPLSQTLGSVAQTANRPMLEDKFATEATQICYEITADTDTGVSAHSARITAPLAQGGQP